MFSWLCTFKNNPSTTAGAKALVALAAPLDELGGVCSSSFPVLSFPSSHGAPKRVPFSGVRIQAHWLAISADERKEATNGVFPPPDAAADAGLAAGVWHADDAGVSGDCGVKSHGVFISSACTIA